jgi:hypothetical protein
MKVLLTVLIVTAASFAGPGLWQEIGDGHPSTDDVIDSNAFDAGHMYSDAFPIYANFWTADDFTPSVTVEVQKITIWIVTTAALPTEVDVFFWADAAPGPGSELLSVTVDGNDLDFTNSGVTFGGFPIYILEATLPAADFFFAFGGLTYWTAIQRTSGGDMLAIMDNEVSDTECFRIITSGGPWVPGSSLGHPPTDMFRIIEGQGASSFEQNTWGAIKAVF